MRCGPFPGFACAIFCTYLIISSPTLMNRVCMKGSVKRFGFSVGSRSPAPPFFIYVCHLIKVPCCSPLPEAKDGVEPSFQDLQSDTFPLCYPAKPTTSCAKVKRLFFLPRSLSTYAVAGGALYMTGGRLPEKRGQLLSPLPCSIFLF